MSQSDTHTDTDRYPIYEIDGEVFYRASAIGGCINELVLFRRGELGEDRTQYIEDVMQAGHEWEADVRERVAEKAGMVVVTESESVGLSVDPGHTIVGNTDGKLFGDIPHLGGVRGSHAGVEIKTLGEDAFKDFLRSGLDRFPNYQWQVSIYMHATGLPWIFGAAPRMREKDGETWKFWAEPEKTHVLPVISTPPISLAKIRRKVRRINTLAEMEIAELPLCEKAKFCSMVRFHELIGGNVAAEEAEVIGEDDELHGLILQRRGLKLIEDKAAGERKDIDERIKKLIEGPVTLPGVGRMVPVLMPGATTLDKDQLRMDLGPEVLEKYEKQGSPYAQLRWYEEKK